MPPLFKASSSIAVKLFDPVISGAALTSLMMIVLATLLLVPPSPSVTENLTERWAVDGLLEEFSNVTFRITAWTAAAVAFVLNDTVRGPLPDSPPAMVPIASPPYFTVLPLIPI